MEIVPFSVNGQGIFSFIKNSYCDSSSPMSNFVSFKTEPYCNTEKLYNVIDWSICPEYNISGGINPSIIFIFKSHKIEVSGVKIENSYNGNYIKNYKIFGSVSEYSDWEIISSCTNNNNAQHYVSTWDLRKRSGRFFKRIKLTMDGPNWAGNYMLSLKHVDFFGKIACE